MSKTRLQDRIPVAIVTGASGDIGRAITDRLLRENFAVMMFSTNKKQALSDAYNYLRDKYPMCILRMQPGSVLNESDILLMLSYVEKYMGNLDLLVNAHGNTPHIARSEHFPIEKFRDIIDCDVVGAFNMCQHVGKIMLRQGYGNIINISSIHSVATYPYRSAYAAAKSAIVGMSKVLAIEWVGRGVRVNTISPGQVDGRRTKDLNGKQIRNVLQRVPSGCLVKAEDIANAVMFLYETKNMNGHNLVLDGGLTSSAWYMPYDVNGD